MDIEKEEYADFVREYKHCLHGIGWAIVFLAICLPLVLVTVPIAWLLDFETAWFAFFFKAVPIGAVASFITSYVMQRVYKSIDE